MTSTNAPAEIVSAGVTPEEPGIYADASGGYWIHHFHFRWQLAAQHDPGREDQVLRIEQGNISAGDLKALDKVLTFRGDGLAPSTLAGIFPLTYLGDIPDHRNETDA